MITCHSPIASNSGIQACVPQSACSCRWLAPTQMGRRKPEYFLRIQRGGDRQGTWGNMSGCKAAPCHSPHPVLGLLDFSTGKPLLILFWFFICQSPWKCFLQRPLQTTPVPSPFQSALCFLYLKLIYNHHMIVYKFKVYNVLI